MPESFGARMRQRREEQNITLAAIAEQTKIKRSMLESLERDDLSHWPSGIFRRAYVRSYALAIGLDPDVVVREFLEAHPDPEEVTANTPAAPTSPGPRLRGFVGVALGSFSRLRRKIEPEARIDEAHASIIEVPAAIKPQDVPENPKNHVNRENLEPRTGNLEPQVAASNPAVELNPAVPNPDLAAIARLCTDLGRAETAKAVQPLLKQAATLLDATGLIVWVWDPRAALLRPALTHGYSARVVAKLPPVRRDDGNATAAAFRTGRARVIEGNAEERSAMAAPLLLGPWCAGVLAIEMGQGAALTESTRAVATILAAALAQMVGRSQWTELRRRSNTAPRQAAAPVEQTAST